MPKPIYLDYQATTPLDSRVLDVMMPYLTEKFGNPHSSTHAYGWEAEVALDIAREQVSELITADADDIVFTSGATEANNLAIKGTMEKLGSKRPHLITAATEHKCVLEAASWCQQQGYELTILPVKTNGLVDTDKLRDVVTEQTALVSIMAVNNEIGVIQALQEIGDIAHSKGALFHTDAAQAFGKIPLHVGDMNIDLMSISGHKIYGPKGIGALYSKNKRLLSPHMSGGGQEFGVRSGTQAPAFVAGLGKAAEIAGNEMAQEEGRLAQMMLDFQNTLQSAFPTLKINGDTENRWRGNLNVTFPGLDGALLLSNLRGLALSSGAACASSVEGPSYVLEAIGVPERDAKASLRMGIGRMTTKDDLVQAADMIMRAVNNMGGL